MRKEQARVNPESLESCPAVLQSVLDAVTGAVLLVDEKGCVVFFNAAAAALLDIAEEGQPLAKVLPDLPHLEESYARCMQKGGHLTNMQFSREGRSLALDIRPVFSEEQLLWSVCTIRQETPKDFSQSEQINKQLDAVFESSHDGLFITDGEGNILKCNQSSEGLIGHLKEDIIGRNVKDLVSEGYIDKSVTIEVLKQKTSLTILQKIRNGKSIIVTGTPVFDDRGEIAFVVTNERDITDLNRMKSQLSHYLALAEMQHMGSYSTDTAQWDAGITAVDRRTVRVFQQAEIASQFDTTILIQGETGVGKGLLGRFIHDKSPRKNRPFVQINCGAIPEQLIESELFGYRRGAFTGAHESGKQGLFSIADGGTLFLDEISEIPLRFQVKFLKAIEDHEILPVGDTRPRKVDVRIIAATNTPLEDLVAQGRFRRDLFFRLNVVPIHIPPLRERSNDIVHLILRFLEKMNTKFQSSKFISPEAMAQLLAYPFPGNIRELENIIERMVILCPEEEIRPKHLAGSLSKLSRGQVDFPEWIEGMSLKQAVERYEQGLIRRALEKYGSKAGAARALGVDPSTIVRKTQRTANTQGNAVLHG